MTRSLTLLRHAEAVPAEADAEDFNRALTARGHAMATEVGRASRTAPPDLVLCSPARRTRETLDAAAASWAAKPTIRYESMIYSASVQSLLEHIRSVPGDTSALWVVGHNPGLAELATLLAAGASLQHGFSRRFPTSARAVFDLEGAAWSEIGKQPLSLSAFLRIEA